MRILLGSGLGKVGFALTLALFAIAAIVLATYPRDFGPKVWSNPAYWADNPKLAPPFWTSFFDRTKIPHQVFRSNKPHAGGEEGAGKINTHRFRSRSRADAPPSFLSFSISNLVFWGSSPVIEVYLEDGNERVFVFRHVVPGARQGETPPVVRYQDAPYRTKLTVDPQTKEQIDTFFAALRAKKGSGFSAVVQVLFGDPRDEAGEVKFVVGGYSYGWLGTDTIGRDLAQGILFGLPIALFVALSVAVMTTLAGAVLGGISGYFGGKTDALIQFAVNIMATIPALPLIIFFVFTLGARLIYVVLFLIVFGWMGLVVQLRPWIFQLRELGFIAYAEARGLSSWRVIFVHVLPQTFPFLFAHFVLALPGAILAEAGLSFLGLGDPSLPSWGFILEQGYRTGALLLGHWWWVIPPGAAIVLTALVFRLIALALEIEFEPRLRRG